MDKQTHQAVLSAIELELARIPSEQVLAAARAISAERPEGIAAILFYGSCLHEQDVSGGLIDFYVVVDNYRDFHNSRIAAFANWLIPPNVYYLETIAAGAKARMKYAVISRRTLQKQTAASCMHATIWGRLCQPCRLVYVRDREIQKEIEECIAQSVSTFYSAIQPLMPADFSAQDLWCAGLARSYRTEFRAESETRPEHIYSRYPEYFEALTQALVADDPSVHETSLGCYAWQPSPRSANGARGRWHLRRIVGRALQVLRLSKGAFTFAGGLDYILYKVEKHSGKTVNVTDWQRRHPLLAAPGIAWQLYRVSGFR